MENPEKSQNKGDEHGRRLRTPSGGEGCRGSGRDGQGILECVLTPTFGQNREGCSPACRTNFSFGFGLFFRSTPGGHPSRFCPSVVASTAFPESPARPTRFPGIPRRPMASAAFCRVLVDECGG